MAYITSWVHICQIEIHILVLPGYSLELSLQFLQQLSLTLLMSKNEVRKGWYPVMTLGKNTFEIPNKWWIYLLYLNDP